MNPSFEVETSLVWSLLFDNQSVRIGRDSARKVLLDNTNRVLGGNVRYYQIKHIGLDVYEVRLLPVGKKETVLVEVWKTVENGL